MVKKELVALDTNIVIDVLNGKADIIQSLRDYQKIYLPIKNNPVSIKPFYCLSLMNACRL